MQSTRALVLAIETSGPLGSVALAQPSGEILIETPLAGVGRNASALLPAIHDALRNINAKIADIRLVCFSQGPGSFTGLRVAATTARMLQSVLNCDVVGVPTLTIIARGMQRVPSGSRRLLVLLDAKADHAFIAEFRLVESPAGGAQWIEASPAAMRRVSDVVATCDAGTLATGSAALRHQALLRDRGTVIADDAAVGPAARHAAAIGIELHAAGRVLAPHEILPLYVRAPEAEEVYELRRQAARDKRGE